MLYICVMPYVVYIRQDYHNYISMNDYAVHIAGDVGQDLVELQVLKVANNRLGEHEAELNDFITSAPV